MSAQHWTHGRGRGGARQAGPFATRNAGFALKNRAWICIACRAWHDVKPKGCINPNCTSGKFLHFDSKVEAQRFAQLWMLQDHGRIAAGTLVHHPRYDLCAPDPRGGAPLAVAYYEADSTYVRDTGARVVEDVKPRADLAQDPVFKIKRRWFEAQYGLAITIVS